jgi:hypothetical protein
MTGTGTKIDPYVVTTWNELMTVLPQENTYAILNNDIDMKGKTITNSGVVLACDFDGQNHLIKNVYLSNENLQNPELFKMYYANSFRNVKFVNWYVKGRNIFSGDSSYSLYRPMPTLESFSFSGELVEQGRLISLWSTMHTPTFKKNAIFIIAQNTSNVIEAQQSYKPIFEDSTIEIYGECNRTILSATLNNSHLLGDVKLSGDTSLKNAIEIDSSQNSYQSLIDLRVEAEESWTASFNGSKLLVETDLLSNVTTSGTFIACTLLEKNDSTFLASHGFNLDDTLTDFSWNDWLASLNKSGWWDDNANYVNCPYSVDNNKFMITVTDLPSERTTNTEPYLDWQSTTVYFTAEPYQKYKFVFDAVLPDEVAPRYSVYSDGVGDNDHRRSGIGEETIIDSFNDTSQFSLQIGVRNQTDNPVSGTYTIDSLAIYKHSSWAIVNSVLTNVDIPTTNPIGSFCNCVNLENVSIPESVKFIGPYAFYNTKLKKNQNSK